MHNELFIVQKEGGHSSRSPDNLGSNSRVPLTRLRRLAPMFARALWSPLRDQALPPTFLFLLLFLLLSWVMIIEEGVAVRSLQMGFQFHRTF